MKYFILVASLFLLNSCCNQSEQCDQTPSIQGTWQLISSEYHKKDTITSNMNEGQKMIKIITPSHFAFLLHDLNKGKDSTNVAYMSGGGSYSFEDGKYIENLEYCTARNWEGHTFDFELTLSGDTLTQIGVEELEDLGLGAENMLLIEKYVRVKTDK